MSLKNSSKPSLPTDSVVTLEELPIALIQVETLLDDGHPAKQIVSSMVDALCREVGEEVPNRLRLAVSHLLAGAA